MQINKTYLTAQLPLNTTSLNHSESAQISNLNKVGSSITTHNCHETFLSNTSG